MEPLVITGLPDDLTSLARTIHADNIRAGWWKQNRHINPVDDGYEFTTIPRNIGELLCLVHSEISEADEGMMGALNDDKLPHRRMGEVELADTAIRVLDILGYYGEPGVISISLDTASQGVDLNRNWNTWCRAMHRATSGAMEGFRKSNVERGCAQLVTLLGLLHYCAITFEMDLTGAIAEKRAFNATRADHKLENRQAAGGKTF